MRLRLLSLLVCALALLPLSAGADELDEAPVDRAGIESAVNTVLDDYLRTFNAMDPKTHMATLHFPHYRLAQG